jgi:hypothetical protein
VNAKNFAFVQFRSAADAANAIKQMSGQIFYGSKIGELLLYLCADRASRSTPGHRYRVDSFQCTSGWRAHICRTGVNNEHHTRTHTLVARYCMHG